MRVGNASYTEIASPLLVDVRAWAICTNCIGTNAAVMLSKEIAEVAKANDTIWLLFIVFFVFESNICVTNSIPARFKATVRIPPPTINDLLWGSSLVAEEFSWESISSVALLLRRMQYCNNKQKLYVKKSANKTSWLWNHRPLFFRWRTLRTQSAQTTSAMMKAMPTQPVMTSTRAT